MWVDHPNGPSLAPSDRVHVAPAAWRSLGVGTKTSGAIAALSVGVGYAVSEQTLYATAGVTALAIILVVSLWPRRAGLRTYEVLMYTALVAYLLPLLAFGKIYATVGSSPIYLPDVLIVVATLFMLPFVRLRVTSPFPSVCTLIALLALHSVYVGYHNGYHEATKGIVLALYPLIALVVAGWLASRPDAERLLSALPKYTLPLVPVGLAILLAVGATVTAAAAGLYLGVAGSFAIVPGMPRRRLIGTSVVVGTILLVGLNAKRGPALTILLAVCVAWIASGRFRSDVKSATAVLALGTVVGALALTISLGLLVPTRVPVAGPLISRALASDSPTTTPADAAAANNVGIRQAIWSYALHATNGSPLFGLGAAHPIDLTYRGNDLATQPTGPHNSFIGYAFYAGYPAAILVLLAFGIGLGRIWRLRWVSPYAPALLGAIVAVIVTALTNVALETTYIGGPSWLVLAAAIGLAGACRDGVLAASSQTTSRPLTP